MKILQAMAGAEYGGAEEFFVRLAIALNCLDIQQRVVIRENGMRARRLRAGGVEPIELRFGSMLDVVTPWKMKRQLSEFEPDIVLTWMNRATKMCPKGDNLIHVGRLGGYYNLKNYEHCDHLIANICGPFDHNAILEVSDKLVRAMQHGKAGPAVSEGVR